ncbi:hypothetical protein [Domibacillus robiginosus]|uniref:hypothetical protein n=1 Tax=Domibacillus robiginosus TaxID=1071054 RepID=UPI00067E6340|nr:hypothetical protein [Domibacillus robiginosus]
MNRDWVKSAITVLMGYHEKARIGDHFELSVFLDGLCDPDCTSYILRDLQTLADVLKEKEALYLIDYF